MSSHIFEMTVEKQITDLRRHLAEAFDRDGDGPSSFMFRITASGRIFDGDVSLTYRLENLCDSRANVEGNSLDEVIAEYLRRNGWAKRNSGVLLPAPSMVPASAIEQTLDKSDDEIPF